MDKITREDKKNIRDDIKKIDTFEYERYNLKNIYNDFKEELEEKLKGEDDGDDDEPRLKGTLKFIEKNKEFAHIVKLINKKELEEDSVEEDSVEEDSVKGILYFIYMFLSTEGMNVNYETKHPQKPQNPRLHGREP